MTTTIVRRGGRIYIRPRSRQEWLEYRRGGIGSSEVATIVGLNPYETPYQLWRRKLGIDPPKEETFAMTAGHYLEDAVARFWEDATGCKVIKRSAGDWLIRQEDKRYLQVSPDRTYWLSEDAKHNDNNKGILECKTTQRKIDADDIPQHWFCQLQYQLGVAELQHGSLAWLTAGREFGYKEIDFVPEFYEYLIAEVERFWVDNIEGGKEPASTAPDDILLRYTHTDPLKVIEADDDVYDVYRELKRLRETAADLDAAQEALEDKLKLQLGDAETLSYHGETIATWKATKPTARFDTKAFRAAHPELAAQYTTTAAGTRRFTLK